ncbi:Alpha/beta superfamily hydrolase [Chitinophaga sp. CF118]|uniref:alpha/beta hydrolase n=1 Tax=Chitinophaga sp. CF118 TaxID=1884367 RepID=UPI0008E05B29|nr:alpha/beta hydrolase [Chitinophaga sp. CF118]SFF02618.1 Alpha/beta superfamily hydrolase [Chitinophaga sp. CF118]
MLYKLIKKPFVGSFMVKWRSPLTEEEKIDWQEVSAKSKSGGIIKGLFAKARTPQPKATILLGHPMGKEAKAFFLKNGYTDLLRDNGYNTLIFDFNGFGESTNGSFSYFEDVLAIAAEAQKITPDLPMGYHGISLGGQWAIISFADQSHPFKFSIIESASTTTEEFWIKYPVAYKMLKVLNFFLPRYAKKIRPVERIKEAKNLESLLLIYSYADELTPVEMGERLKANSPVPTELWTVKDAPHTAIMKSAYQDIYKNKIIEYFNNAV